MTLVILAAGMGSRFGGLKQMASVGQNGEIIADFSVFDAKRAGFNKVVFVIKKEMEENFHELIISHWEKEIECVTVFQSLTDVPSWFTIPGERTKPWGTAHATMMAKDAVDGPFMVINADDFYGASAYREIFNYLNTGSKPGRYCMAGYYLKNTVTEYGTVSRGECGINADGFLTRVTERVSIEKAGNALRYRDGDEWRDLPTDTIVSMNAWGFTPDFFDEAEKMFEEFLKSHGSELKSEFYLPSVPDTLIRQGKATVKVLPTTDLWYGFTYKEDMPFVQKAVGDLVKAGKYPEKLWR